MVGAHRQKVLDSLPAATGVYQFKDRHGKILYVGKAVDIRARVRQYFSGSDSRGAKVRALVRRSTDVSYILTDTEFDALVLEANLIKQFKPAYNVMMKDDKSFPYIHLTADPFPRVVITRRFRAGSGNYWGPYTNLSAVKATVKFAAGLFGVRTCKLEIDGKRKYPKPCLDYHLKLCSAPCVSYVNSEDYAAQCRALGQFFDGRYAAVRELLEERMLKASQRQAYEQAARYRDLLRHLEKVVARTQVAGKPGDEMDAIGFTASGEDLMVLVLQVRDGRLVGDREFVMHNELNQTREEMLANFLKLYYFHPPNTPRELLLPFAPADFQLLADFLSLQKNRKVTLTLPRRGYKREILQMAATNTSERMRSYLLKAPRRKEPGEAARQLAEMLALPTPPQRIEGYDVSNIQGRQAAGAMVVFKDARPEPSEYRIFNIRLKTTPDDFAMMREVLRRRLLRMLTDERWSEVPDLILLDGGKGQLSSVLEVVEELSHDPAFSTEQTRALTQPRVVALAKREETIITAQPENGGLQFKETHLNETDPGLSLLIRVRDEAHRFCVKQHRRRRQRASVRSVLDDIAGIGPARRKRLLAHFGSTRKMREAGLEEIAKVPGVSLTLAQRIYAALLEESFMDIAVEEMKWKRTIHLKRITPKD